MEIRAAKPEETDDALRVLCAAFDLPFDVARPIFYRDPFYDLSHKRLLCTPEDGIVSCLTIVPSRIRVGAAWVSVGGIAGVATQPSLRGRGYAGRLLQATVAALADELCYPVSGLFALSEGLYRRLGWETVTSSSRHTISLPLAVLPPSPQEVRAATDTDYDAVRALHAVSAEQRTGGCQRDDRRWRLIESVEGRQCAVIGPLGGGVTGYVYWERHGESLRVLELWGVTPEAQRHLIVSLTGGKSWATRLEWSVPRADWLAAGLPDGVGDCVPEPGLMLRLTDVSAAFAAIHAANFAPVLESSGRTLTIRAVDSLCPKNARPVRLTPRGVMPGDEADPDWIAADVRALAPIYLGFRVPSEAQAAGDLAASSLEALALADRLFPRRDPFVAPLDQF